MLIQLLIYWVITQIMPVVDSAPFKNGVFDHLTSNVENESSDGYLSNDMAVSILRKNISPEESDNTRKYDDYTFDYSRCIQFNNRILCGYEKNKGTLLDDYTMFDIGNGCRTRGDRIECGYDNPHIYTNLRNPAIEHRDQVENDKHNVQHHHHEINHNHRGHHHHLNKHHDTLPRQAPTRTTAITDPTTPSIILNRMKTDYLENKLLKSALGKLVMKAEETKKESVKTTIDLIERITSTTDTVKPLTTTTITPIMRKSTPTPGSIRKLSKPTTSKTETITSTSSESNEISDGEPAPKIVRLKPVIKQKRRLLTELLSRFHKLVSKPKLNGTIVRPTENSSETKIKDAVLQMKTGNAEKKVKTHKRRRPTKLFSSIPKLVSKSPSESTIILPIANNTTIKDTVLRIEKDSVEKTVKTACVEQQDRVVCYDFKI